MVDPDLPKRRIRFGRKIKETEKLQTYQQSFVFGFGFKKRTPRYKGVLFPGMKHGVQAHTWYIWAVPFRQVNERCRLGLLRRRKLPQAEASYQRVRTSRRRSRRRCAQVVVRA